MFTLQRLNVVRVVDNEKDKSKLIDEGFKDITPKEDKPEDKKADNKDSKPTDSKNRGK